MFPSPWINVRYLDGVVQSPVGLIVKAPHLKKCRLDKVMGYGFSKRFWTKSYARNHWDGDLYTKEGGVAVISPTGRGQISIIPYVPNNNKRPLLDPHYPGHLRDTAIPLLAGALAKLLVDYRNDRLQVCLQRQT